MKLADTTIGTRLGLGLGVILLLVAVLGGVSWRQSKTLWEQTEAMYHHPLAVSRAVGRLDVGVETMSRCVRDLLLFTEQSELHEALRTIEAEEAVAVDQLAILRTQYLGPLDDVTRLQNDFESWALVRDETIRLLQAGRRPEALARIGPSGVQHQQSMRVRAHLHTIIGYARAKSDELYRRSEEQAAALEQQLALIVGLILVAALAISVLLGRGIRGPIGQLTRLAERFRNGDLGARAAYGSANEVGLLAGAFNALAATVEGESRFQQRVAELNASMLSELEVREFGLVVLRPLVEATGSRLGAIYVRNDRGDAYDPVESIGVGATELAAFSASVHDGEIGTAVASRRICRIVDIPEDTRFTFAAVSGTFRPREIMTIPLLSGTDVPAVISLASVHEYTPDAVRLVERLHDGLSVWMTSMLNARRVQRLTEGLEGQNRELKAQKVELTSQASELGAMNRELEAQRRQLLEANRLKSTFLSNMSHELRTPLNSVIALAGVLGRRIGKSLPADERSYLEIIERNGKILLALINDILDLSRVEAGREELRRGRVSIRELVAETVAMLDAQAREKGIGLRNDVPVDLPPIVSDLEKCRRVLQNLVSNAVKFTDAGTVKIGARPEGETLEIVVTDTGIGIEPDKLEVIFEEFRQADDGTARKYGGTGLGLAIARRYARLLGGDIAVSSVVGEGSRFALRLPLVTWRQSTSEPPASSARPMIASSASLPPSRRGGHILLVEDSEAARIQVTDILEAHGYRVSVAVDGKEALERVAELVPDAVILDLMMPGVDGFEVLAKLRAVPRTAKLPVLILTAKHVSREELSFLTGNHIHQLIYKGEVDRSGLLGAVAEMMGAPTEKPEAPGARAAVGPAARPGRARRPRRSGKPIVLVVEDNPDNLRTARALLEGEYRVVVAEDGQAAIDQARRHEPDVILMDISLPVLDGVQALEALRADEALCDIPVIAATASAMAGDREQILAHGFDGYLSKPLDHALLHELLRETLRQPLAPPGS